MVKKRCQCEGPEHELRVETQQVERVGPLGRVERAERFVRLGAADDVLLEHGNLFGRVPLGGGVAGRSLAFRAAAEAVDSGGNASSSQLSACRCKKSGNSMMWLSASKNVPPVAYGMDVMLLAIATPGRSTPWREMAG